MAPLDGSFGERDEPSGLDELTWKSGEPKSPDLLYDPLELEPDRPPAPPLRSEPADGSNLLFRGALSAAALLVLFVVVRGLWWPETKPWESAPEPTAPPAQAAPAPQPVEPSQSPEIVEEPILEEEEEPAEVPPVASSPEIEEPDPEVVAEAPPPPAPAATIPQPASAPAAARRLPPPWEEGPQPPDLLRPGPGIEEPVPLEFPSYSYPAAAQGTGLQVDVRLALLVDERGRVIEARVREGAPPDLGFAETALAVARQIAFQPATRYDIPGKMWTEVILEFVEQ
jgi:TonB family protein